VDVDDQWWFDVVTGHVEHGPGSPNSERLGPYATKEEAEHALQRARERNEAWDAQEDD
jgi:hypothetical protein